MDIAFILLFVGLGAIIIISVVSSIILLKDIYQDFVMLRHMREIRIKGNLSRDLGENNTRKPKRLGSLSTKYSPPSDSVDWKIISCVVFFILVYLAVSIYSLQSANPL